MMEKLPYYMTYPMPVSFDTQRLNRRDAEYMKSLYPKLAKTLMPYVEEECDRQEFGCSVMYDEYPDKLQLQLMVRRIFNHALDDGVVHEKQELLHEIIEILLYQEIFRRRNQQREAPKIYELKKVW